MTAVVAGGDAVPPTAAVDADGGVVSVLPGATVLDGVVV